MDSGLTQPFLLLPAILSADAFMADISMNVTMNVTSVLSTVINAHT